MKAKCDVCQLRKSPMYYFSITRKMCSMCYAADKKTKKSLIKSLPVVASVPAPLGHRFFWHECLPTEAYGKTYCEVRYGLYKHGAVN